MHHRTLRVADYPADGVYSLREFDSEAEAYRYLQRFARNPVAMERLEELLDDEDEEDGEDEEEEEESGHTGRSRGPAQAVKKKRDILVEIAELIAEEELGVAEAVARFNPPTKLDDAREEPPPQPPPPLPRPTKKLTWIEFKVVDDASGKPVNWVRLVVRTPDGNQTYQTTNSEGLVRMEELEPGMCDVSCELKNPTMQDMLAFMGMGETSAGASGEEEGANGQNQKPGTMRIADIERHKVKTGETLDGLAKKAGMTWKDLAKFNWGTDVPREINGALRRFVGCTKKTADGANYKFDDTDDPGIVLIPKPWKQEGLATGETHVVRVSAPKLEPKRFRFSI
ncbi:MAG TPA: LysM domain-containing protein [Tepidisphaeraceae bacterium]|nr:LysM domain-containing protein [Tepidisphaeraceae bacterium]